jgi:hypothetical protein
MYWSDFNIRSNAYAIQLADDLAVQSNRPSASRDNGRWTSTKTKTPRIRRNVDGTSGRKWVDEDKVIVTHFPAGWYAAISALNDNLPTASTIDNLRRHADALNSHRNIEVETQSIGAKGLMTTPFGREGSCFVSGRRVWLKFTWHPETYTDCVASQLE